MKIGKIGRLTIRFLIFWGMVVSALLTVISGLILWLAPHGPQSSWAVLYGLQKSTWLDLHPYLAFLAIGLVSLHLFDKWRCLKIYFKSPLQGFVAQEKQRKEMICEAEVS